jgi:hypothetical protein
VRVDEVTVSLDAARTLTVDTGRWLMTAAISPFPFGKLNPEQVRPPPHTLPACALPQGASHSTSDHTIFSVVCDHRACGPGSSRCQGGAQVRRRPRRCRAAWSPRPVV